MCSYKILVFKAWSISLLSCFVLAIPIIFDIVVSWFLNILNLLEAREGLWIEHFP